MRIPTAAQSTEQFSEEVLLALSSPRSHVYIDTSFLIWLAQLGEAARNEFIEWVDRLGRERVHIPVWSSHEYFRHHTRGLIPQSLSEVAKSLNLVADDSYAYLRPFLDRGFEGDSRSPAEIKNDVRETLVKLKALSDSVRALGKKGNEEHGKKVIEFINAQCLQKGNLFEYMKDLATVGDNRFTGRLPPGYQDDGKRDSDLEGGNKYGDLVFWSEVLDHAKAINERWFERWLTPRIDVIVILSNDRKNDWRAAGPEIQGEKPPTDLLKLRRSWKPVPRAHPMLEFEAKARSRVDNVYIVDSDYLAAIFYRQGGGTAPSHFVDAALSIELPSAREYEAERRKRLAVAAAVSEDRGGDEATTGRVVEFTLSRTNLRKGLVESKKVDAIRPHLDALLDTSASPRPMAEMLTSLADELTLSSWVTFGRHLYAKGSEGVPLAKERTVDLIGQLRDLPPRVSIPVYLGLLAGIYLDLDNTAALPPKNHALTQVMELQTEQFAQLAIDVLVEKLCKQNVWPAYIPDSGAPRLTVDVTHRTIDLEKVPAITTLRIGRSAVVTESQAEESLQLRTILAGKPTVFVSELINQACSRFGIPRAQVEFAPDQDHEVTFAETTGFELPSKSFLGEV
jgi:hypothetical protein